MYRHIPRNRFTCRKTSIDTITFADRHVTCLLSVPHCTWIIEGHFSIMQTVTLISVFFLDGLPRDVNKIIKWTCLNCKFPTRPAARRVQASAIYCKINLCYFQSSSWNLYYRAKHVEILFPEVFYGVD